MVVAEGLAAWFVVPVVPVVVVVVVVVEEKGVGVFGSHIVVTMIMTYVVDILTRLTAEDDRRLSRHDHSQQSGIDHAPPPIVELVLPTPFPSKLVGTPENVDTLPDLADLSTDSGSNLVRLVVPQMQARHRMPRKKFSFFFKCCVCFKSPCNKQ